MLRSIYEIILGAFRTPSRRPAPRRARLRRLALESLESRKLLTVATMTYGSISDGDFAAPTMPVRGYQVAPASCPWQWSGTAGVSANNSSFTNGDPPAPSGTQVAFIKDNASMSQIVYLDAGVYNLSVLAAQRLNYQTQNENVAVLVDNQQVGVITPASAVRVNNTNVYVTSYGAYETSNFVVAAGEHTIKFLGLSPATADSTAFLDAVAITPVIDALVDGGFETPPLAVNSFQTDPQGSAWQFAGTAGVARNGSAFTTDWVEAQNAPEGAQVAYLEYQGSMSQTLYLDAGTYQLSFLACQRAIYQTSHQEIEVLVDNTPYGTINPINTMFGGYQSSTFTIAAAGIHTIKFLGLDPQGGDNTAFIDAVTLSTNAISDGSFETPALNAQISAQLSPPKAPAGSPWQYSGTAGVDHNGASLTFNNPAAPNGTQVAYIQANGGISQSVNLIAGTYDLSFQAAQRAQGQTPGQQIKVLVDNVSEGVITPVGTFYHLYASSNFTVSAGIHTVQILGLTAQGSTGTALIDEVALMPTNGGITQDQIGDGGFETPALPTYAYQAAPTGSPWQFPTSLSGSAGITTNNSGITSGSAYAPQGRQAGFIVNNGSMSQTIYLDADTYNIAFMAAQRHGQAQSQTIEVLVDAQVIALITPSITVGLSNTNYAYSLYQTLNFTVAAGPHVIEFRGMNSSSAGSTAFLDEVSLVAVRNTFSAGSFEAPVLAANSYVTQPSGSGWQFAGSAGISTNFSGFTNGSAYAPYGNQVAFIKNDGSFSQPVYFDAGTYSISFQATQRIGYQNQQIEVLVDGATVSGVPGNPWITPVVSTNPNVGPNNPSGVGAYYIFTPYQTSNFTVTAGPHTIEFLGMTPATPGADRTAFIDAAAISTGCAVADGSFEAPALAWKTYVPAPTGTPWQYSGMAGVSANASAFTFGNPVAPNGYQVAYIKDTGSISQAVYLAPGYYCISYMAAERYNQTQPQTINVSVVGPGINQQIGSATPSTPQSNGGQYPAGTNFGLFSTVKFQITTAGWFTITFKGTSPTTADSTAFIDNVRLNN